MSRVIAIDYGLKRTGIAVSDELQLIASGLTTIETNGLLMFLKDYFLRESVALILVGQPKRFDNSFSDIETTIQEFILKLQNQNPEIPIKRIDERFTSKIAFQSMIDSGMKKKERRNKANIDEISATLILQSYLYYK
ncbi:MAG: Holliday junction resolvase RuvX [Flavobacteriaceae bacterium]|nr:Holliday junction resolvase RuvX [Flavobacteriaceae bacterium]